MDTLSFFEQCGRFARDALADDDYKQQPLKTSYTIAWNIWHMTRIEDLTMNLLVHETEQVFNAEWQEKINISISDSGNPMKKEEFVIFICYLFYLYFLL